MHGRVLARLSGDIFIIVLRDNVVYELNGVGGAAQVNLAVQTLFNGQRQRDSLFLWWLLGRG